MIFIGFRPAVKAKDKAHNNYGFRKEGKCFTMTKRSVARNWEAERQEKKEKGETGHKHSIMKQTGI